MNRIYIALFFIGMIPCVLAGVSVPITIALNLNPFYGAMLGLFGFGMMTPALIQEYKIHKEYNNGKVIQYR